MAPRVCTTAIGREKVDYQCADASRAEIFKKNLIIFATAIERERAAGVGASSRRVLGDGDD